MKTIGEALAFGRIMLASQPVGDIDSYILLAHVLNINNWRQLSLMKSQLINKEQLQCFEILLKRRQSSEPVALILGTKEFWGLDFKINKHTLIPRPETELIIDLVQRHFPDSNYAYNILDLGTGSGCLLTTLLSIHKNSTGVGVDLSTEALLVANHNAQKHNVLSRAQFIHSNWLSNIPAQKFDIIVCNPPYIPAQDIYSLIADVKDFEPHSALTDFNDGLQHYKTIFQQLPLYTSSLTHCFIEFGITQGDDIAALLEHNGYNIISREKDLAGIERSMIFRK